MLPKCNKWIFFYGPSVPFNRPHLHLWSLAHSWCSAEATQLWSVPSLASAERRTTVEIYCFCLQWSGREIFVCAKGDLTNGVFGLISFECLGALSTGTRTHICNGISIMVYLINIITRPINLPNGSDPLIAGVETSIFEAIKHTFWWAWARRRRMAARWMALLWHLSETEGGSNITGACCCWSALITTHEAAEKCQGAKKLRRSGWRFMRHRRKTAWTFAW